MYINDPQFGNIVDFDQLRQSILHLYNALLPDFDMHKSLQVGTELYGDEPDVMIAAGASMLAWMTIIAAGEDEIAEELKNSLFTLGWTEEEIGSDLLSATTVATPMNEDPACVDYYLKGRKWLINNSYHGRRLPHHRRQDRSRFQRTALALHLPRAPKQLQELAASGDARLAAHGAHQFRH